MQAFKFGVVLIKEIADLRWVHFSSLGLAEARASRDGIVIGLATSMAF